MSDRASLFTVLDVLPRIIPGCDRDVSEVVSRSFKRRGIEMRTGVQVHGHSPGENGTTVSFGDGEQVTVDAVVVSVGRRPGSEGLLAPGTGVRLDQRGIVAVEQWMGQGGEDGVAVG